MSVNSSECAFMFDESTYLAYIATLTLGAHAQQGLRSVSPSVRLSGTPYSGTTRNKSAKKRVQGNGNGACKLLVMEVDTINK